MTQVDDLRIVGVGASAGGLKALTELLSTLPCTGQLAVVVVQHLSPHFKSVMDELLAARTALEVVVATDGMVLRPDTVYLNQPHSDLTVEQGAICLGPWAETTDGTLQRPIDVLFQSLAEQYGERAIGVVLSGTGSDGSRGLAAIHDAGGLTAIQQPDTATFPGMPESAQQATVVNLVLPPEELPEALLRHLVSPVSSADVGYATPPLDALDAVCRLLVAAHGIDLSMYKRATVERRIARRIGMLGASSVNDYLQFLTVNPSELETLYTDLLIGVTEFLRDPEAFDALGRALDLSLMEHDGSPFRVWVPACATGEEAYSIAMLLLERLGHPSRLRVFATDLHEGSVQHASRGEYRPRALDALGPERVQRFFRPTADGYRVSEELRQCVVFAAHDLLADPPFSGLHLVSCRNLLIYLNARGQSRAMQRLVFAMAPHSLLMLGTSESPGAISEALTVVDSRWKLYRRQLGHPVRLEGMGFSRATTSAVGTHAPSRLVQLQAYDTLLERYAPAGLLVDGERRLLHVFGEGRALLTTRPGRPTHDALALVNDDLRQPLASALSRARVSGQPVVAEAASFGTVRVEPLHNLNGPPTYLVTIGEPPVIQPPQATEVPGTTHSMEGELERTRQALQTAVEVAETSNEELQATNEELVASNEELQSTNEELQSVNEELHTVNAEFRDKNDALIRATADLEGLVAAIDVGILFLDAAMCIRRFNPLSGELLGVRAGDEGRPFQDLAGRPLSGVALSIAQESSEVLHGVDARHGLADGRTVLLQARPLLSPQGTFDGVVLALVDVTELKTAQDTSTLQQTVLQRLPIGLGIWRLEDPTDPGSFRFLYANEASDEISGLDSSSRLGRTAREAVPEAVAAGIFENYRQVVLTGRPRIDEFPVELSEGRQYIVRQSASAGPDQTVVILFEDVTADAEKRAEAEHARQLQSIGEVAGSIAHELNNQLAVILLGTRASQLQHPDSEDLKMVSRGASRAANLVSQLLAFAKRRPASPRLVDIQSFIHSVRPVLGSLLGPRIQLSIDLPADTGAIHIDPAAIEQVFLNLATNTRNAIGDKVGHVHVTATLSEGTSTIRLGFSDDGPGMSPTTRRRCFEPFFTTQAVGMGTGLGLPVSKGLVEQAGGSMWVESEPGRGTTFFLEFAHETTSMSDTPEPPPAPRMDASILLVDDEELLCRVTAKILKRAGYDVVAVGCASDALAHVASHGPPDLVVTDVLMPDLTGPQLVARLREEHPRLRALFVSGYTDHVSVRSAAWEDEGAAGVLAKPFEPEELLRRVYEALQPA